MPVSTPSESNARLTSVWTKIRDAIEGEDRIKEARDAYLPIPSGMDQVELRDRPDMTSFIPTPYRGEGKATTDYDSYLQRASFYGATPRTVAGLVGAILRKKPEVKFPKSKEKILDTITRSGDSFDQLIRKTLEENVSISRLGLLTDAPESDDLAPNKDFSPYIAEYLAENIISSREEVVEGKKIPVRIVLRELASDSNPEDPFVEVSYEQWRVLHLGLPDFFTIATEEWDLLGIEEKDRTEQNRPDFETLLVLYGLSFEEFSSRIYWQEIWVESDETASKENLKESERRYVLVRRIFPRRVGGLLWDEIPFEFVNATDLDAEPKTPVLVDLVNLNISHYRNSADLEWGLHICGLPTPWAAGFGIKSGASLRLGGRSAWVTDEPSAKAGMLEFTGAGLGAISKEMEKKENRMAVLGARLLEEQKAAQEAAETVRLRQSGESSILATISKISGEALQRSLVYVAKWLNLPESSIEEIEVKLSGDFNSAGLSSQELVALTSSLQSGSLSFDAFFYAMERGEMYPEGWTKDDEARALQEGIPGYEPPAPAVDPNAVPTLDENGNPVDPTTDPTADPKAVSPEPKTVEKKTPKKG